MSDWLTRRRVLAGLLGGAAAPALAGAPATSIRPVPRGASPPPLAPPEVARLIDAARLGGRVAFHVVDAATGEPLETRYNDARMPPASVAKAATALYAHSVLGPERRFLTQVIALGPVEEGRVMGDLALVGSGDPTLDTDALGDLATQLKEAGIFEVTGVLRLVTSALPDLPWIDPDQPDHVGYNPAISGLNLNFNRVHFEWKKDRDEYAITMQARDRTYRPAVNVVRMAVEDRRFPVFTYARLGGIDRWTVARGALGREGARWLPVRDPAAYTADVFRTLARSHGIVLRLGPPLEAPPEGTVLAVHESAPMDEILGAMLRNSINLSAETVGLAASRALGHRPGSLIASARAMNRWAREQVGGGTSGFVDHSGLGYGSRISPADMVALLGQSGGVAGPLPPMMKRFSLGQAAMEGAEARAKTGTLNFVSALAGYVTVPKGRDLIFAIFTADMDRRDAIRVEDRERPPGARSWDRRSRTLQRALINRWIALASA
jgi:D-alanyl-D-alanine carboxypeptidase/D-alanyl-D-alanine-endopeptidase (penicillin-binding protein 4)